MTNLIGMAAKSCDCSCS